MGATIRVTKCVSNRVSFTIHTLKNDGGSAIVVHMALFITTY